MINRILQLRLSILNYIEKNKQIRRLSKLGYCGKHVFLANPKMISDYSLLHLHDYSKIYTGLSIISQGGKLIFKQRSCAAQDLTVVTGSHGRILGEWFDRTVAKYEEVIERDVIVEEDVWIGTNVTLLSGAKIGRGATVGAGAVVRGNVPPYSIVTGNPAKVVGFSFKPEEVIEHEKALYPEEERLPLGKLEKNYNRYFLNRLIEIRNFTSL